MKTYVCNFCGSSDFEFSCLANGGRLMQCRCCGSIGDVTELDTSLPQQTHPAAVKQSSTVEQICGEP